MNTSLTLTMKALTRLAVIQKLLAHRLSEEEARKLLGLQSTRQVRRIKKRIEAEGPSGIVHKNCGKVSNRSLAPKIRTEVVTLLKAHYADFKPTFAAEKLEAEHKISLSKETLRQIMITEGLWKVRSRKGTSQYHTWRARKDNYGEMQQFDGSYHKWFEDRAGECCLLLAIDDATGRITHACFADNEGVCAVFGFWMDYFTLHGLPISVYLDKFSTYKINHPSAVDNSELMTQFQRAMRQVDVRLIHAHSPQAKGRVERVFQTLQDRLVKELRLKNISTKEEANLFLPEYLVGFNKHFAVVPAKQSDLHRTLTEPLRAQLPQILSIQSQRRVNNDYTIAFKNQFFQLEELQPVTVFKKEYVTVEVHLNGEIKVFCRGQYLNMILLPERPRKVENIPIVALTRKPTGHIPPPDHPWRRTNLHKQKPVSAALICS